MSQYVADPTEDLIRKGNLTYANNRPLLMIRGSELAALKGVTVKQIHEEYEMKGDD